MDSVLEFICCVVLVFGAMAALFAATVMYIILKSRIRELAQVLY